MLSDKATIQWLNLVHMSPKFVIRIGNAKDRPVVQSPKVVPKNDGEYWVAGISRLKSGAELESVFRVDTNGGGEFVGVYWKIGGKWWDFTERPAIFDALKLDQADVFPFDWSYAVPLAEDIFHTKS